VALLLAGLLLGGLAWGQARIVVSIPPYEEPVRRLAGPGATVEVLLPPGASPHAFDPTPRDVARLERADLIVVNGVLDDWTRELVEALGREAPVFVALDALPAEALREGGHDHGHDEHAGDEHAGDEHGHDEHADDEHAGDEHAEDEHAGDEHGHDAHADHDATHAGEHEGDVARAEANPHVWLDPVRMRTVVAALAERLADDRPAEAAAIAERAARYDAELEALTEELQATLAPVAGAPFVPFHDAWPYFAERFGLELLLEIEPFPGREPSARALAEAIEAVHASGARAIFNEVQLDDRPARVLADEAGVRLATLDPLGGVPGRDSYAELMRFNADAVLEALAPTAP
jgi:ABC-type Zn uptake system ZnuABC Zn-binding protein ZnuA